MEFSGDAIYYVNRSLADRESGGTQYLITDYGDRRTDKYYGVCNTDFDVTDDGDFCVCLDYDCRGIYRSY